ncbi:MAG: gliding motility-associated C-terminal domain-containing protein [Bacteroidetes bacterium]|nr:gliding motility-associated C-terminal domain-containing protein [Bacteroidota bacterium]
MRYIGLCITTLLALLCQNKAYCQNLVPNPSFETYNSCPTGLAGLDYSASYSSFSTAQSWVNPLKYTSPDYFNVCAIPASGVHVPEATFGYQKARTGNAFAGIILWEESKTPGNVYSFAEYLQCKLISPMVAGKRYCVSFYVSPTIAASLSFNYIATDEIGINFSNTQIASPTGSFLTAPYHIVSPANKFMQDTAGWIKVTGTYVASGGEEWLVIGRFNNTSGSPNNVLSFPSVANPSFPYRQYVYIDDVNVSVISPADTIRSAHDATYCNLSDMPMTLSSTAIDGDFLWITGDVTKQLTVAKDGIYTCVAFSNCRIYMDTFYVKYDANNKLSLGKELVNCNNQPVTIVPNRPFTSYLWSTGATTQSITVNTPGVYWLKATNKCGTQSDTVAVFIQPPTPMPTVRDTMLCQMTEDAKLNNVAGVNLKWYTHQLASIGSPIQPYIYSKYVSNYTYFVTQTIGKCESPKAAVNINIKYTPKHELEERVTMCQSSPVYIGTEYAGVNYFWNIGSNSCCIKPDHEGKYTCVMSNECGIFRDSTYVTFDPCEECIAIPNAFTPDGDGVNDKFFVLQTCPVNDYRIRIYNRWGQVVFESRDIKQGWTGTDEGRYLDEGAYIYLIEYQPDATHIKKQYKGTINLIR